MQQQIVFNATPDDFRQMLEAAMKPLTERIHELESKVCQNRDYYTIEDLAQRTGFSTKTVRSWISDGRTVRGGSVVKLAVTDNLSDGRFRVSHKAWLAFQSHFHDIILPPSKNR